MNRSIQPWIEEGYKFFAINGPSALKVEVLAKLVDKNKSSFYHHFVNLEIFIRHLLTYHLERSKIVMQAERDAKNVVPELIEVFVKYKEDLLFNRQLRIHKSNPEFEACYSKASEDSIAALSNIWANYLGLPKNSKLARLVLILSIENFFLQITPENLNYEWLKNYVENLRTLAYTVKVNEIIQP